MAAQFISGLSRIERCVFSGYVLDPMRAARRFVIEALLDGRPAALAFADSFDAVLAASWKSDGRHAFLFELSEEQVEAAVVLSVRLANSETPVGAPINLRETPYASGPLPAGFARLAANGRIEGAAPKPPQSEGDAAIRLVRTGQPLRKIHLRRYQAAASVDETPFLAPFSIAQDESAAGAFEDVVEIADYRGRPLPGSPVAFQARKAPESQAPAALRLQVVALGESAEQLQLHDSKADWSLVQCPPMDRHARISRETLEEALSVNDGAEDVVVFLGAGLSFAPQALDRICVALLEDPNLAGIDTILDPPGNLPVRIGVPAAFLACRRSGLRFPQTSGSFGLEELFTAIRAQREIGPFLTLPGLCVR
jgi:hypothetical protein